jgi:hypothetical protein
MSKDTDWNRNVGGGFGHAETADEYFHGGGPPGDSLTETWYWGFNVPAARINCYAYCWTHPNLKVVTAGLFIYQGRKLQHLACEVFELRDYLSMDTVGDGSRIVLPNGFQIEVVEPLQHIRMRFQDDIRATRVNVDLRAAAPPVMRANNQHFEQLMHVTGSLVLRGEHHQVDCFHVRDRSWGELRPEDHAAMSPPYTWVTGAFGEGFAFNVGAHDDPTRQPDWAELFKLAPEDAFKDGWVLVNGEQRRLASASILTHRDSQSLQPLRHELEFEDTSGANYHMTGEVVAIAPWSGWSNMNAQLGMVEWSWDGQTGWGDSMDCHWNDYVYLSHREKML